jgi:hypothetical protein
MLSWDNGTKCSLGTMGPAMQAMLSWDNGACERTGSETNVILELLLDLPKRTGLKRHLVTAQACVKALLSRFLNRAKSLRHLLI